ncbi:XrtA system polysaccharide chain length determinant [Alteriqipengyuania lutimaris]|uniref:Chain-length determining protein n=1 Tax=Alteriqipengyuania lutimaris TaxID=1538146 RepID=A0A395LMH4_9SPHN|nr:XrtA system polysaccharide chain length determinant [Alteriqipengyuania lutimaris]MBB3032753.1 polysaccharide chain length determinant protein (PEP-CTERM system associated) [Alteriqipengyuania lutimaris]RDS78142.1 chain-length determining protein [Alteriqipengyuania lutimaris]
MNELFDEVRAALYSAWSRKWLVLGVAWAVCLTGWLFVATIPNTYESQARIFIQLDDMLSKQIGIAGSDMNDIVRVRQRMASASTLGQVVEATRLGEGVNTPRDMENAIASLAKKVQVRSEDDNLFEITAYMSEGHLTDNENAQLARDVVDKLLEIFREANVEGTRGEVNEAVAMLDRQLDQRASELEEAEARRTAFEAEHPELIGGSEAISSRLQNARSEMRGVEADLAAAQSALAQITGQLAGTPQTLPGGAGGGSALDQAEAQVAQLRARGLKNNHPDMQTALRQVQLLRQSGGGGSAGGIPNPAYSSLVSLRADRQATVQALLARKAALQADMSMTIADQASEPGLAAEAKRIGRDYEVLKNKYDELLKDREEMELRSQVESERSSFRFDIIDAPAVSTRPAAPNRPLLLLAVMVLGVGAGLGTAIALTMLRSTFSTSSGLSKSLGLPVAGTISRIVPPARKAAEARQLRLFYVSTAALAGLLVILLGIEFVQVGQVVA